MFFKIKSIEILSDFIIRASFENNVTKTYNFKPLFAKYPVFEPLKQESFFNQAVVDCGGYGIKWNDDIDVDAAEIWYNGVTDSNSEQDIADYLNAVGNEPDTKLFIKALDDVSNSVKSEQKSASAPLRKNFYRKMFIKLRKLIS